MEATGFSSRLFIPQSIGLVPGAIALFGRWQIKAQTEQMAQQGLAGGTVNHLLGNIWSLGMEKVMNVRRPKQEYED
jgi:hypothetical protein